MKFIIFVIDRANNPATANEMAEIDKFNSELRHNGNWVMAAGIQDPSKSKLIDNREDNSNLTNGSIFKEIEFYSGFWIIEAADQEAAETMALAGSRACNRKVELRPFYH